MDKRLERILPRVQKPARYVGGEYNAVMKDLSQVDTRVAFCFPDTYEIGMSNLGMRILYGIMNNMEGVWCERVFAPWGDMEEEMRACAACRSMRSSPAIPIRDFDIIAFSVGYEMAFPGHAEHARSGGRAAPRERAHGADARSSSRAARRCSTASRSPISSTLSSHRRGRGDERRARSSCTAGRGARAGRSRSFSARAAQLDGIYVPEPLRRGLQRRRHRRGRSRRRTARPKVVTKRIVRDMDKAWYPAEDHRALHRDRARPHRRSSCSAAASAAAASVRRATSTAPCATRSEKLLVEYAKEAIEDSGYEEMTLSSLSTSDFRPLVRALRRSGGVLRRSVM